MTRRAGLLVAAALLAPGCRHREITKLEREQSASLVSEAQFAMTLRDWARAEGLLAQAAGLCPDSGDTWTNLGMARAHLHNAGGARSAYKSALDAYADALDHDPADGTIVVRRATVLVLLGRADDARSYLAKQAASHPDDARLRAFVDGKAVDRMLADPSLKDVTP